MRAREIIDACRFFHQVDPAARARLAEMATLVRFSRGDLIFRQDDPCPGIYVVGQGQVRIYKLGPSGKEHVLHLAGPGQTFAEVAAIGQFPCPAFAEALEDTDCALLPADRFNEALRRDHAMCLQIIGALAGWVRQLVGLMEDIVLRDATSRLASWLLQTTGGHEGTVAIPSLKKHLASHLNLTSETLSRSLRRLEESGVIERTEAGRVRVKDLEALGDASRGNFPAL